MTGGTPRWAWLLHGNFARMDQADRHRFLTPLARSAHQMPPVMGITMLLEGEWRSRLAAAWLIGLDVREQFRRRIGELLLASQGTYADQCPRAATAEPGTSRAAHKATAAKVPPQLTVTAYLCMVDRMEKRKATFLLSAHTLDAAKTVAQGGNMSAFVDRALRNETLRAQLATSALPELSGWLDDAEADQAPSA